MNMRIAALSGAMLFLLTACPNGDGAEDAGVDAGADAGLPAEGGCTGGCGPLQVCDAQKRICVTACQPACGQNELCVREGTGFKCTPAVSSCGGNTCAEGQNACLSGACSCLPFTLAAVDTCAAQGRTCAQPFDPGTQSGGSCQDPGLYEYCNENCAAEDCGSCQPGLTCARVFGESHCMRPCNPGDCGIGELCSTSGACFPKVMFGEPAGTGSGTDKPGYHCVLADIAPGGAVKYVRSTASDRCVRANPNGTALDSPSNPTGTCTWMVLRWSSSNSLHTYCREPGPIPEFGACRTETLPTALTNTCGTGMECMPTGRTGEGTCRRICNARLRADLTPAEPACPQDQACLSFRRIDDPNKVPGACVKRCNVFSSLANHGCGDEGGQGYACVPTSPHADRLVSLTGDGVCLPRLPVVAAAGEPCSETDPYLGAACQSGLACINASGEQQARCAQPCDLGCDGSANQPERCSTQSNSTCQTGTCTQATSTSGALLGFCR